MLSILTLYFTVDGLFPLRWQLEIQTNFFRRIVGILADDFNSLGEGLKCILTVMPRKARLCSLSKQVECKASSGEGIRDYILINIQRFHGENQHSGTIYEKGKIIFALCMEW